MNLDMVPWNLTSGAFAYIWQSKWVGIIIYWEKDWKNENSLLSNVLIAVTSLDLKVPIDIWGTTAWTAY